MARGFHVNPDIANKGSMVWEAPYGWIALIMVIGALKRGLVATEFLTQGRQIKDFSASVLTQAGL